VTRAAHQTEGIAEAIRAAGGQPVFMPMLCLVPPAELAPLDEALGALDRYDGLLLTSVNAVEFFAERARTRGVALDATSTPAFCVGPRTAEAARLAGLDVAGVPERRFDAEGLLDEIGRHLRPAGARLLLPRSERGREILVEGLAERGAQVDAISVYRHAPPAIDPAHLREQLVTGALDALTFTSPSTVENFSAMLDAEARHAAQRCAIGAIGPVTAEALRDNDLPPQVMPERAEVDELVGALADWFAVQRGASG